MSYEEEFYEELYNDALAYKEFLIELLDNCDERDKATIRRQIKLCEADIERYKSFKNYDDIRIHTISCW